MRERNGFESAAVFLIGIAAVVFVLTASQIGNRVVVALIASVALFQLGLTLLVVSRLPRTWRSHGADRTLDGVPGAARQD